MVTKVNIYRSKGEWCYAAWSGEEFDHSDPIGVPDSATEAEAKAEMAAQFPGAEIRRGEDVR